MHDSRTKPPPPPWIGLRPHNPRSTPFQHTIAHSHKRVGQKAVTYMRRLKFININRRTKSNSEVKFLSYSNKSGGVDKLLYLGYHILVKCRRLNLKFNKHLQITWKQCLRNYIDDVVNIYGSEVANSLFPPCIYAKFSEGFEERCSLFTFSDMNSMFMMNSSFT